MHGVLVRCAVFAAGYIVGMVVKEREFGLVLTRAKEIVDERRVA